MFNLTTSKLCSVFNTASTVNKAKLQLVRHLSSSMMMKAWKLKSRNSPHIVLVTEKIPTITSPNDVLIQVHSTSINPLDARMRDGYGLNVLDTFDFFANLQPRITSDRYPLILGRDFSGVISAVGANVKEYTIGDQVYGCLDPHRSGSHAQYITAPKHSISLKPNNLSHNEATSVPFVALTAWSALCTIGRLSPSNCSQKSILVVGGSGGIGSVAIQLLKHWGANVTTITPTETIDWVINDLKADQAVSFNDQQSQRAIYNKFDFVLDGGNYENAPLSRDQILDNVLKYLKPSFNATYVTLTPPVLANTDKNGLVLGMAESAIQAVSDCIKGGTKMKHVRWGFYMPNSKALKYVTRMLEDGSMKPYVSCVLSFDQIEEAYKVLREGKFRGKVVVDVTKMAEEPSEN